MRRVRFPRFKTREKRVGTQEVVHRTLTRGSEKAQPLEITSIDECASQGEPEDHCTSELPVQDSKRHGLHRSTQGYRVLPSGSLLDQPVG